MTIEIRQQAEETVLVLAGRLDTATAPDLEKTIREDIADTKQLVLDMAEVPYISSAGLRVLLSTQKKMQGIGAMKLTHLQEEVMDIFEMTGFIDILEIV